MDDRITDEWMGIASSGEKQSQDKVKAVASVQYHRGRVRCWKDPVPGGARDLYRGGVRWHRGGRRIGSIKFALGGRRQRSITGKHEVPERAAPYLGREIAVAARVIHGKETKGTRTSSVVLGARDSGGCCWRPRPEREGEVSVRRKFGYRVGCCRSIGEGRANAQ